MTRKEASAIRRVPWPGSARAGESTLESSLLHRLSGRDQTLLRWMGWRLRLLVGAALIGWAGILWLAHGLGAYNHLHAEWRPTASGAPELVSGGPHAALKAHEGRQLTQLLDSDGLAVATGSLLWGSSPRWGTDDQRRALELADLQQLSAALAQAQVTLVFDDAQRVDVHPMPRGLAGLSGTFWLLSLVSLVLYLVAMVLVLAQPSGRNLLYAVMAICQCANLLLQGIVSSDLPGLPAGFIGLIYPLQTGLDLAVVAAIVHASSLHPHRLPGASAIAAAGWFGAVTVWSGVQQGSLASGWWWIQATYGLYGLAGIGLLAWSHRIEPHPFAVVLQRFGAVACVAWLLLTAFISTTVNQPVLHQSVVLIGPMTWHVFFALVLLFVPFLSRVRPLTREFALLAGVSAVATSLDLLFVAIFSLGQFASLTLALFVALAVYAGARQWTLDRVLGRRAITIEQMFGQLYQVAREVELHPEKAPQLLERLLRDLFDPLEWTIARKRITAARAVADGSTLLLPVPQMLANADPWTTGSIVMRFAHRGRRLFTDEDAQLAGRIVEQLERAIAFDRAVEQGRSEERARLAQDLHDDIGARLLTLMYQAPSQEMESYIRHTLQDLKTLTRGLAAPSHCLSHAIGEWKADLTQRLALANVKLHWHASVDEDVALTVVQWSAWTRVLRELVSNVIAHAGAQNVSVSLRLAGQCWTLEVSDDGHGREPQGWAPGLGVGGVRKRVRQLGGDVAWQELSPRGIRCTVSVLP